MSQMASLRWESQVKLDARIARVGEVEDPGGQKLADLVYVAVVGQLSVQVGLLVGLVVGMWEYEQVRDAHDFHFAQSADRLGFIDEHFNKQNDLNSKKNSEETKKLEMEIFAIIWIFIYNREKIIFKHMIFLIKNP